MRWNRPLLVSAVVVAALAMVAPSVGAQGSGKMKVKPLAYDPLATGTVAAAWQTHQGLPDKTNKGKADRALFVSKTTTTATPASGGAVVYGEEGRVLTELGFDYRDGSHCGAGAPRYNVTLDTGAVFFFGCSSGDVTGTLVDRRGATWHRVRFTDADAVPADGTSLWPGLGAAVMAGVDLVYDEGTDVGVGFAYLDNLDVNGVLIGKPGNAGPNRGKGGH